MRSQNENGTRIADHGIFCQVSGGLTGTRTAWLKDEAGLIWEGTKDEAETKAARLNTEMNSGCGSAHFSYMAMERE